MPTPALANRPLVLPMRSMLGLETYDIARIVVRVVSPE
jgi:hypothetical protein